MKIVKITRKIEISASHQLYNHKINKDENIELFGKCINNHGHNYKIFLSLRGIIDDNGMVMNINTLKKIINDTIVLNFDHKNLNDHSSFKDKITTTENFAVVIWDLISNELGRSGLQYLLHKVKIKETANNSFSYYG